MTRILKTVALTLATFATGAFAQSTTATQTFEGNVGDALAISGSATTATIPLVVNGTNQTPYTLTVNATKPYTITAAADAATMREHDGEIYTPSGATLTSPPTIDAAAGTATEEGTAIESATLTTGGVAIWNGTAGTENKTVISTITQPVSYADKQLTGTNKYRMVVTYTIAATL